MAGRGLDSIAVGEDDGVRRERFQLGEIDGGGARYTDELGGVETAKQPFQRGVVVRRLVVVQGEALRAYAKSALLARDQLDTL